MSCSLPWRVLHAQSSTNSQYPIPTLMQHYQHCKQQAARACPDKNHRITIGKVLEGTFAALKRTSVEGCSFGTSRHLPSMLTSRKTFPFSFFSSHLFAFLFSMKVAFTFTTNLCHQTLQMDVSPLQTCFNILCSHCPYKYTPSRVRE